MLTINKFILEKKPSIGLHLKSKQERENFYIFYYQNLESGSLILECIINGMKISLNKNKMFTKKYKICSDLK